jgi:hypothetical protein
MQSPQPQSPQPHETGGVTIPGTLPARAPAREEQEREVILVERRDEER